MSSSRSGEIAFDTAIAHASFSSDRTEVVAASTAQLPQYPPNPGLYSAARLIANRARQTEQPSVLTRPAYTAPQSAHRSATTGPSSSSWSACDAAPSSYINSIVETSPRQALARRVRIEAPSIGPASDSGAAADRVGSKSPTWTPSQSPICTGIARPTTQALNGSMGGGRLKRAHSHLRQAAQCLKGTSGSPQNKAVR